MHFVARAHERVEVHALVIHFVVEVAPAVGRPFLRQGSGCYGDLVRRCADGGAHVYPIAVLHQVGLHALGGIGSEVLHALLRRQLVVLAIAAVQQFTTRLVAYAR